MRTDHKVVHKVGDRFIGIYFLTMLYIVYINVTVIFVCELLHL